MKTKHQIATAQFNTFIGTFLRCECSRITEYVFIKSYG